MAKRDGPLAFGRPDPAQDRLQPDAVLVGRPDFDRLFRGLRPLLGDGLFQLFLNASRSSGVAEAGWRGRGFCTDQPIAFRASPPPCGQTSTSPSSPAPPPPPSRPAHPPPPGRPFRARPPSAVRRWLKQTSLELLQQVGLQDGGARSIPAPQIAQSLRTPSVVAGQ